MSSIQTDAAYALKQLRGVSVSERFVTTPIEADTYDRVQRAIDALERIEAEAKDGGPAGTPAVTELSIRTVHPNGLPKWFIHRVRVEYNPVILIDSHSTCGPAGRQTFEGVACVIDPSTPNPGLLFRGPTTVGLSEKIIAFIKTRPWEE